MEEKRLGPGQKTVRLQVGLCVLKKKKKEKNKMASVLVSSLLFLFGSHRCDCVCVMGFLGKAFDKVAAAKTYKRT